MKDPVLASRLLLDFEDYVSTVSKAQDRFFSDRVIQPAQMTAMDLKKPTSRQPLNSDLFNQDGERKNTEPDSMDKRREGSPLNLTGQKDQPWTQMSINCIMNCGEFSSDQMTKTMNERAFGLVDSPIIKKVTEAEEVALTGITF